MQLTCPKCQGSMRSYERAGIVIDQCSDCRGVYLDRGELEKLIDAEAAQPPAAGRVSPADPAWGTPAPPTPEQPHRPARYDHRYGYQDDQPYGDPRYSGKRRKSFLEDLFD
jgi:Zn-finger nucleic acid-binding protein